MNVRTLQGTHAYMVSKEGAQKLLGLCTKAVFHVDLDVSEVPNNGINYHIQMNYHNIILKKWDGEYFIYDNIYIWVCFFAECNDNIRIFVYFRDFNRLGDTRVWWYECSILCWHIKLSKKLHWQMSRLWGTYVLLIYITYKCTVLYSTVQYSTVLYCTVLHCTVLYCTVISM